MNKRIVSLVLLLPLLFIVFCCQRTNNVKSLVAKQSSDNDLIMEAKSYFVANVKNSGDAGATQTNNHVGSRFFNHLKSLAKTDNWNNAYVVQLSNVKAVVIPLIFSTDLTSRSNLVDSSTRCRLILFQNWSSIKLTVI